MCGCEKKSPEPIGNDASDTSLSSAVSEFLIASTKTNAPHDAVSTAAELLRSAEPRRFEIYYTY